ncbi:hypothetical protein [Hydrogenophaga sp.]|uniref:hypothetical protein n=1 Tax=Hydrogenophaga sp. TaxID=1904254 RepID=UPI002AC93518|nr:hypothetical protein [Hydrogenophaga sp.]
MEKPLATSATPPVLTEPRKGCTPNVRPNSLQPTFSGEKWAMCSTKITGVAPLLGCLATFD